MLTLLRKIHFKFLAVFQDSAQREHTIVDFDINTNGATPIKQAAL